MSINYKIVDLEEKDFENGFLECLEVLTEVGDIKKEKLIERFDLLKNLNTNKIIVARENGTNRVIATGALVLEYKYIRNLAIKGHIEDICVLKEYQGNGLGKNIILELIERAKSLKCYKIALVCKKENVHFYEKCGFNENEVEMVIYTKDK